MSLGSGNFQYVETELCPRLLKLMSTYLLTLIWRFQPQGRADVFNPDLDRAFGFIRSSVTDRSVAEQGQLQKAH